MDWKSIVVQNEIGHHNQQNVGETHTQSELMKDGLSTASNSRERTTTNQLRG